MRLLAALAALTVLVVFLGGCSNPPTQGERVEGRTREFVLEVAAGTSNTAALYELNDGNQSRVVAITFRDADQQDEAIPSPELRVQEGDTVRLTIRNSNPLGHTFHLHGGLIPWDQDGVDYLTQMPIMAGEERTYVFENMKAGTYWYHCHVDGAHHIDFGMYGAFIVEEREPQYHFDREYVVLLDEMDNCHVHGNLDPVTGGEQSGALFVKGDCTERFIQDYLAQNQVGNQAGSQVPQPVKDASCPAIEDLPEVTDEEKRVKDQLMTVMGCVTHGHGNPPLQQTPRSWWFETAPVYTPLYNTFLVNGKAFPDTPVFHVEEGEVVLFRLINAGNQMHSWHPHGHNMQVTHRDGYALPAPFTVDTLTIGPGERYDVLMTMDNPGLWMVHDQNGLATMNDDQHPGGMMACFAYDGFRGVAASELHRALDCNIAAMRIMGDEHQH
ncbi:MAG: hypothetical protein QOD77_1444 [Thermoplasmata archaeon]|jgi:FtsP/CotA-like multicopper oxidase with cupredoxin domain|nr:hypothetical protein [Thermoplasmata archaeon]